jgi:diguanylate cyclase (GGDEF)-like protein
LVEVISGPQAKVFGTVRALLGVLLFGGTALVAAHDWLGLGGSGLDQLAGGALYDSVVVAAGIACLLRAYLVPRERAAWVLIGLGILVWAAAEVYWTGYILNDPSAPYPSPADIGYVAFYPLAAAGLAMLVRARADQLDWLRWTDGAIAALGTAALGTAFVFDFIAEHASGTSLQMATTLAYPLGDILMLSLVIGVIALSGWRPDRTWALLLAGLAAMAIADIAYTLQSTEGTLPAGNWIDPIYLISASFLGSVLWRPTAADLRTSRRSDAERELVVPAFFASVMIGLFAMQYFSATSGLSTVLWAATMLAVIARLAISVRENRALLEQVRTDTLTGLSNRGAMQIELDDLLQEASTEEPAAVVLLDLNGFKRYNDTFGHLAGDELLSRLGRQLERAIQPYGSAYRIGGDEFCVLLDCSEVDFDKATRAAATGLSEKGKGYDITASWGIATIPREATVASEALGLADVRMYAQKESRRLAPDSPDISSIASPVEESDAALR